jgi:RNA polymerase sigma-70 factor (ECF subfamily)
MDKERHAVFAERFVRNENRVYRYIFSLVPRRSEAEELFQETSLTLWQTWERYNPDVNFISWACGIAHNLVRNHLRKRRNQPCLIVNEELLDQLGQRRLLEDGPLEERRRVLATCVETLPERQRQLVEQVYSGVLSMKEIAAREEQTPNSIYKVLRRIRAALHDCVDRKLSPEAAP